MAIANRRAGACEVKGRDALWQGSQTPESAGTDLECCAGFELDSKVSCDGAIGWQELVLVGKGYGFDAPDRCSDVRCSDERGKMENRHLAQIAREVIVHRTTGQPGNRTSKISALGKGSGSDAPWKVTLNVLSHYRSRVARR